MKLRSKITNTMIIRFGPAGLIGTEADCKVVNAGVFSRTFARAAAY